MLESTIERVTYTYSCMNIKNPDLNLSSRTRILFVQLVLVLLLIPRSASFITTRVRGNFVIHQMSFTQEQALEYCCTSENAVVATLWPSAGEVSIPIAEDFFRNSNAAIVSKQTVRLHRSAAVNVVRALYDGEDWLESNCWYHEQPLDSGPPDPPFAGAKWKAALCFNGGERDSSGYFTLLVYVLDASKARSLWSNKYSARSSMSRAANAPGNSCMHLTDSQVDVIHSKTVKGNSNGDSYSCDESYAFQCARCLLDERSVEFLNSLGEDFSVDPENGMWHEYTRWLRFGGTGDGVFER